MSVSALAAAAASPVSVVAVPLPPPPDSVVAVTLPPPRAAGRHRPPRVEREGGGRVDRESKSFFFFCFCFCCSLQVFRFFFVFHSKSGAKVLKLYWKKTILGALVIKYLYFQNFLGRSSQPEPLLFRPCLQWIWSLLMKNGILNQVTSYGTIGAPPLITGFRHAWTVLDTPKELEGYNCSLKRKCDLDIHKSWIVSYWYFFVFSWIQSEKKYKLCI